MFTRVYHVNVVGETFSTLFMMLTNLQHLKFKTPRMKLCEFNTDGFVHRKNILIYIQQEHLKHVEQCPDKIDCVILHLVGYILDY